MATHNGYVLTTRAAAPGRFARRLLVETFAQEQGMLFLLRRAGLIPLDADISQALPQDRTLAELITQEVGGLPLALDQIGAYLETTGSGLATYWQQYQEHRTELLKEYRGIGADHPQPVATTWSLSLSICEQQLGPEHPRTAFILHDLAHLYASQGKYMESGPLYLRALAIRERQLGPEHPDTAYTLHDLAHLYVNQNKYVEAESLYQRALAICVQQLGPEHPDTQITQERYASLLQQKRNP